MHEHGLEMITDTHTYIDQAPARYARSSIGIDVCGFNEGDYWLDQARISKGWQSIGKFYYLSLFVQWQTPIEYESTPSHTV